MVCLIDPIGDVYACPFAIHDNFLAGNLLADGGFQQVWQTSELFAELRSPQTGGACAKCQFFDSCRGGCMAAKFFTGLPLDGPDPECVQGYGEAALAGDRDDPGRQPGPLQGQPDPQPAGDAQAADPARRPVGLRREPAGRLRAGSGSSQDGCCSRARCSMKLENPWKQNPWFESVAVAQQRARKRLPAPVYGALVAGSERGQTIADNQAAFAEIGLAPHVAGQHAERAHGPHRHGPGHLAAGDHHPDRRPGRAPRRRGRRRPGRRRPRHGHGAVQLRLASRSRRSRPPGRATFFQMYWTGDRDVMVQRMQRAHAAGALGLIATLDWSFSMGRDWGSPEIPEKVDLKTMVRMAPQVVTQAALALPVRQDRQIPDLTAPNLAPPGQRRLARRRRSSAPTTSG